MDCDGCGKDCRGQITLSSKWEKSKETSLEAIVKIEAREKMTCTRLIMVNMIKIGQILHVSGKQNNRIKNISI